MTSTKTADRWLEQSDEKDSRGELRKHYNVHDGDVIPINRAKSDLRRLKKKSEGDKTLSKRDLRLFRQLNLYVNVFDPIAEKRKHAMSLRQKIIRLAYQRPELRSDLLPIVRSASSVAETILQQLGGPRRVQAMLGVKQFLTSNDGVQFKFPNKGRGKPNYVKITLNTSDTYTVEFGRVMRMDYKKLSSHSGIYAEQLKEVFEKQAKLRLSL